MSHFSPTAVLLWAILSTLLLLFLVWHLWKFDRFASLGWRSSHDTSHTGSFKRFMIYSYLCSVPLLLFYSVTFAVIKYYEGYFVVSAPGTPPGSEQVIPLPFELWDESPKRWILALYIAFSFAWALEIVSHLEELNFWLFLMSPTAPQTWFRSFYFFTWAIGSVAALVGLPVTAIVTRHDQPPKSEAWIFFVGSCGSSIITIVSLRVLWLFPRFIKLLQKQGAEPETIVRLSTYSQLNNIRVLFRFLFVVPLLILAIDGIRPGHHHQVNESGFATDFLVMISGIGCIVQSMLTLLVFFPRSIVQENGFILLTQPSISGGSHLPTRVEGQGDELWYPHPMAQLNLRRMGSMPTLAEDDEHRRKAQEWLAKQEEHAGQPLGRRRTIAGFGTKARGRSLDLGNRASVTSDEGTIRPPSAALRNGNGVELEGGPDLDQNGGGDRNPNRDTLPSVYSFPTTEGGGGVPLSSLPVSHTVPPSDPPGETTGRKKSFRAPHSLPTVVEPATSRVGSPELPHSAIPLVAPTRPNTGTTSNEEDLSDNAVLSPQSPQTRTSEAHALSSPSEWDHVDLEIGRGGRVPSSRRRLRQGSVASKDALLAGERRPSTRPSTSGTIRSNRSRNELADVPFDEMRARGSRYSELAARQAVDRGQIHPYLKRFRSPLDLYDSVRY